MKTRPFNKKMIIYKVTYTDDTFNYFMANYSLRLEDCPDAKSIEFYCFSGDVKID
jgi:hypothetical protein